MKAQNGKHEQGDKDTPIKSNGFNSEFGGGVLDEFGNNISRLSSKVQLGKGDLPQSQEVLSPNKSMNRIEGSKMYED